MNKKCLGCGREGELNEKDLCQKCIDRIRAIEHLKNKKKQKG